MVAKSVIVSTRNIVLGMIEILQLLPTFATDCTLCLVTYQRHTVATIPGFIPFFQHHRELHSPLPLPSRRVTFINDLSPRTEKRDARLSGHALALPRSLPPAFSQYIMQRGCSSGQGCSPVRREDQRVSKVGAKPSTRKHFLLERDRRSTPLKVRLV